MKKIVILSLAFLSIGLPQAYGIDWEIIQQNLERWRQYLGAIQLSDPCNIIYGRLVTMQECPSGEICHAFEVTLTTVESGGSDTCHIEGSGEGRRLAMGTQDEQFRGVRSNGVVVLLGDADITNDDSSFSYDVTNTTEFNAFDHFELSHRPPFSPVRRVRISFSNFLVNGVENPITQVQQEEEEGSGGDACRDVELDDGDACTDDLCNPTTGVITHIPISFDDDDPCTEDSCDPTSGEELHTAIADDDGDGVCNSIDPDYVADGSRICADGDDDGDGVCNADEVVEDGGPRPPGRETLRNINEADLRDGAGAPGGGACALNTKATPSGFGFGLLTLFVLGFVTLRRFPRSIKR